MKKLLLLFSVLLFASPAMALETWPTANGGQAPLTLGGCLNSSGKVVPVDQSGACPAGGGGGGGTVTQGTAGSNAAGWWTRIGDGTTGPAKVQAGNSASTTDTALTVSDPNVLAAMGQSIPAGANKIGLFGGDGSAASPSTNVLTTQGGQADATASAGSPIAIGGIFETSPPTYTSGQRTTLHTDNRGNLPMSLYAPSSTVALGLAVTNADGLNPTTSQSVLQTNSINRLFNGSTFDRAFTCTQSAVISVTAGSTTQIVGLSGSTVIRVCSFAVSMSAAGTAKFMTGTGTNCGTGGTDLTAAMNLGTTLPMSATGMNGSLFRSSAGGEICVAAVTGNVTGFLSYAQY